MTKTNPGTEAQPRSEDLEATGPGELSRLASDRVAIAGRIDTKVDELVELLLEHEGVCEAMTAVLGAGYASQRYAGHRTVGRWIKTRLSRVGRLSLAISPTRHPLFMGDLVTVERHFLKSLMEPRDEEETR